MGQKNGEETKTTKAVAEAEPEPIDVSIPYNAAAMLAFKNVKASGASFAEFEAMYIEKVVADVTAKKVKRDAEEMAKQAEAAASKVAAEFEKKFGK